VEDCTINDNAGYGIILDGKGVVGQNRSHTVRNNTISGNSRYGLISAYAYGCLIDGNVFGPQVPVDGDSYAISCGPGRNLVVRNFELGNTNQIGTGYLFFGSDTCGPRVNMVGLLSTTNSPWSNFSR
jgi:parallel beta-helix repeat protein